VNKTLIKNEKEYRDFCFKIYEKSDGALLNSIQRSLGIIDQSSCWDYDKEGNAIDEEGNILPEYREPKDLLFENWVSELVYPFIIVSMIDEGFDRFGSVEFCLIEFVHLSDFASFLCLD
jgi:hypothetical protein